MAGWAVGDLGEVRGKTGTWRLAEYYGLNDPKRIVVQGPNNETLTIHPSEFTNGSMAGKRQAGGGRIEGDMPRKRYDRSPRKGK